MLYRQSEATRKIRIQDGPALQAKASVNTTAPKPSHYRPAKQSVVLRGDVLPLRRANGRCIVRLSNGSYALIVDHHVSDRNGFAATYTAYSTGQLVSFDNKLIPAYTLRP